MLSTVQSTGLRSPWLNEAVMVACRVTSTALHIVQQNPQPESFPTVEHPVGRFTCRHGILHSALYKPTRTSLLSLRWMEQECYHVIPLKIGLGTCQSVNTRGIIIALGRWNWSRYFTLDNNVPEHVITTRTYCIYIVHVSCNNNSSIRSIPHRHVQPQTTQAYAQRSQI